jgi:hypothetical protein
MASAADQIEGERTIEQAVEACYGEYVATAFKRGRNPKWPFVPVYRWPRGRCPGDFHETQIKARAFETREEAVAFAARYIDLLREGMRQSLADPRSRAHRAQWGVPECETQAGHSTIADALTAPASQVLA